jgi:hypothetical protein
VSIKTLAAEERMSSGGGNRTLVVQQCLPQNHRGDVLYIGGSVWVEGVRFRLRRVRSSASRDAIWAVCSDHINSGYIYIYIYMTALFII